MVGDQQFTTNAVIVTRRVPIGAEMQTARADVVKNASRAPGQPAIKQNGHPEEWPPKSTWIQIRNRSISLEHDQATARHTFAGFDAPAGHSRAVTNRGQQGGEITEREAGEEIPTHENGAVRSIEAIMGDVNRAFEKAIRRDPANWFWVHNRWKPRTIRTRPTRIPAGEAVAEDN